MGIMFLNRGEEETFRTASGMSLLSPFFIGKRWLLLIIMIIAIGYLFNFLVYF
jgi:hypothetical protein